jgi:hypothetical protein
MHAFGDEHVTDVGPDVSETGRQRYPTLVNRRQSEDWVTAKDTVPSLETSTLAIA